MRKHKRVIRQSDARVLLSEVLPYEVPPNFTNRGVYDLVNQLGLSSNGSSWRSRDMGPGTLEVLSILLGETVAFESGPPIEGRRKLVMAERRNPYPQTVPFQYTVRHKNNDRRALSIMHPRAQLDAITFYRDNADMMLYYSNQSNFSLRHPRRRARYSVVRDWLFETKSTRTLPSGAVEQDPREYEWLRSYFTYARYSNVFKFYDSPEYRRCERQYGYLVKADITKCFDSIYTHSIGWATLGKELVKQNLKASSESFGGTFDRLMQALNHDETSGILIGPELSRVFAEIILQAVDVAIEAELRTLNLVNGRDYEILRYVDDYFIFLGDPRHKGLVLDVIARNLRPFKLHLNASKEEGEHTPWMSPLTVGKRRVSRLVKKAVRLPKPIEPGSEDQGSLLPFALARAEELVVGYKAVLIDTGASHNDLANFTLARLERATEKVISSSQAVMADLHTGTSQLAIERHYAGVMNALVQMLEFAFFVYSGSPRVSPGIKIARIVSTCLRYSRTKGVRTHETERLERKTRSEILMQLNRIGPNEPPGIETCTLVDCISDLGQSYRLGCDELARVFGFTRAEAGLAVPSQMNAMLAFSILLHIQSADGYGEIRAALEEWILAKAGARPNDGERALLLLNLISCPFLDDHFRTKLLALGGISSKSVANRVVATLGKSNVDWEGFDLYSALQQKRLYEVY